MKKGKNIIFIILAVIVFIAVGVGYYYYWEGDTYLATDNAKVAANLYSIPATGSGKILSINAGQGEYVKQNEVIARIENSPYVKAPIDGTIIQMNPVVNQLVAPTTVMAVLADTNNMYINANIEETNIVKIKENQSVEITLDAFPDKKFKAHVGDINKSTTNAITGNAMSMTTSGTYTKVTQLIPVKIYLDEDIDLQSLIGTNATVKIRVR